MDNLANIKFKEEFNYFKNNFHLISKWHKESNLALIALNLYIFGIIPLVFLSMVIQMPIFIFSFILDSLFIISLILVFHIRNKNKRALTFEKMLYTGPLSDLFEDIEDPTIRYYKDKLISHHEEMKGFKGSFIIKIYQDIITQKSSKYIKSLENEKKVVSELKTIKDI